MRQIHYVTWTNKSQITEWIKRNFDKIVEISFAKGIMEDVYTIEMKDGSLIETCLLPC
jgi:hypothetical protein